MIQLQFANSGRGKLGSGFDNSSSLWNKLGLAETLAALDDINFLLYLLNLLLLRNGSGRQGDGQRWQILNRFRCVDFIVPSIAVLLSLIVLSHSHLLHNANGDLAC